MKAQYLLLIYSPLLVVLLPLVFLYERFVHNEDDMVEQHFKVTTGLFMAGMMFLTIITWPLKCMGPLGSLIHLLCNGIFLGMRYFVEGVFLRPIFSKIIPYLFNRWNQSTYSDLSPKEEEIRVLDLAPGSRSDPIHAQLRCVSLETAEYEALSYSWGGHRVLRRVINLNSKAFLVTESVFTALRELRHPNEWRSLWIDAICINQGKGADRSSQVSKMDAIYKKAKHVIIWLGKAPVDFNLAIDSVRQIAAAPEEDFLSIASFQTSWEKPMKDVTSRRWWSRVWIIQEIALNHNISVRVGRHQFPWDMLSQFLRRVIQLDEISLDRKVADFAQIISNFHAGRPDPPNGLLGLAIEFRARVASNPSDKLYGLRGLLRSLDFRTITVNYNQSPRKLFARFAAQNMCKEQNLAAMTLAESSRVIGCSWATDWQELTKNDWAQINPFDMVELSKEYSLFWTGGLLPSIIEESRAYNAAGSLSNSCVSQTSSNDLLGGIDRSNDQENSQEWNLIRLTGWVADTVAKVGEPFEVNQKFSKEHFQGILNDWFRLAGGPWSGAVTPASASFCRCLLADAWPRSDPPSPFDQTMDGLRDHEMSSQRNDDTLSSEAMYNHANQYSKLLSACRWNRRFFITEKGRFGLAPSRCRRGDVVCILLGSPVPFILGRPAYDSYECIGQAYVDGFMDYKGRVEDDINNKKVELRRFTVR